MEEISHEEEIVTEDDDIIDYEYSNLLDEAMDLSSPQFLDDQINEEDSLSSNELEYEDEINYPENNCPKASIFSHGDYPSKNSESAMKKLNSKGATVILYPETVLITEGVPPSNLRKLTINHCDVLVKDEIAKDFRIHSEVPCVVLYHLNSSLTENIQSWRYNDSEFVFKCTMCEFRSNNKEQLKGHMKLMHQNKLLKPTLKCSKCDFYCEGRNKMAEHTFSHSKRQKVKCKYCNFTFKYFKSLTKHIEKRHSAEHFEGKKIDKYVKTSSIDPINNLNYIEQIVPSSSGEDTISAETQEAEVSSPIERTVNKISLGATLSKTSDMVVIMSKTDRNSRDEKSNVTTTIFLNKANDKRPYCCPFCRFLVEGTSYDEVVDDKMKSHIKSQHWIDDQYYCSWCHLIVNSLRDLKFHVDEMHSRPVVVSKEGVFKKQFIDSLLLNINEDEKRDFYGCPYCELTKEGDDCKTKIMRHISQSHAQSIFRCAYCDFISKKEHTLKEHEECIHLNLHDLKCNQCLYRFPSEKLLADHVASDHVVQELFKCQLSNNCYYETHDLDSFKRHVKRKFCLRKSDKSAPIMEIYSCPHCNKFKHRFRSKVQTHVKNVHGKDNLFYCHYCTSKFNSMPQLKEHLEEFHKKLRNIKCPFCSQYFFERYKCVRHCYNRHKNKLRKEDLTEQLLNSIIIEVQDGIITDN